MIRQLDENDIGDILAIINDGAQAYRGVIPDDCWTQPYMTGAALRHEVDNGVKFRGWQAGDELAGVMGIQDVLDVTLIRHAYVRTAQRRGGIGAALLAHLRWLTDRPILIGTWTAASWAIRFYEKYGFALVGEDEKRRLLAKYWSVPPRQVEASVVLAESRNPPG